MRSTFPWLLLFGLSAAFPGSPLEAAWQLHKIDGHTHLDSTRLDGDLVTYEKQGDIYAYRFSSGSLTPVTQDLYEPTDWMIDLEEEKLWYWAHAWGEICYDLCEYDVRLNRKRRLFTTEADVGLDWGEWDAGRLVLHLDHDWWLWTDGRLEQLTFSGESLCKQEPWLQGDHLVWRAVAGTPGVYVTRVSTRETWCVYGDDLPPGSLCVSGPHVAWVDQPVAGPEATEVFHYRLDTGTLESLGTSEASVWWQLALQPPHLVWLKKTGSSWLLMQTNLENRHEEPLYTSALPGLGIRMSGDDILLVTDNCPGWLERCWELNVFNRGTDRLSQLTHFGTGSMIFSPWIEGGRIAFKRHSTAFPYIHEAFVGSRTQDASWGIAAQASGSDRIVNLGMLSAPFVLTPCFRPRSIRRKPKPRSASTHSSLHGFRPDRLPADIQERVHRKRFYEEVKNPQFRGGSRQTLFTTTGHENRGNPVPFPVQVSEQDQPVPAGSEVVVRDNEVEIPLANFPDRLFHGRSHVGCPPFHLKRPEKAVPQSVVVFHEKNPHSATLCDSSVSRRGNRHLTPGTLPSARSPRATFVPHLTGRGSAVHGLLPEEALLASKAAHRREPRGV